MILKAILKRMELKVLKVSDAIRFQVCKDSHQNKFENVNINNNFIIYE